MRKILVMVICTLIFLFQVANAFGSAPLTKQGGVEDPQLIRQHILKQKESMGNLKSVGTAIEKYVDEFGYAPQAATMSDLKKILEPRYIEKMYVKDGWGHKLFYKRSSDFPAIFWLASGGSDGKLTWTGKSFFFVVTSLDGFANDIVFSGGRFLTGPKVK